MSAVQICYLLIKNNHISNYLILTPPRNLVWTEGSGKTSNAVSGDVDGTKRTVLAKYPTVDGSEKDFHLDTVEQRLYFIRNNKLMMLDRSNDQVETLGGGISAVQLVGPGKINYATTDGEVSTKDRQHSAVYKMNEQMILR